MALDKPGNLTVHPTARYFHQTVTAWMERQPEGFDDARLVHRLDRETSGVLLVRLGSTPTVGSVAFERKRVRKEYLAIVEGKRLSRCAVMARWAQTRRRRSFASSKPS